MWRLNNINTIPLVLIVEKDLNINSFKNYDLLIDDLGIEKLHIYSERFSLTIKNWRKKVLEELDSLGVKFNSGFIDYEQLLTHKFTILKPTQILSENFKLFPRKLNYYWLDYNKKQIERSIDDFIKMLKRSERIGKKGEEKMYHNFLNNNPSFLLRDTFSNYWYEPKFYKNSTEFEEPDYILKPNLSYETDLSLLEVKLPNERFLTKSKFHPPLMAKLMKHIYQVNDYKDYLESDQFLTEINRIIGYIPKNINYNLLIGRLEDKEENSYMLEKRMRQINQMNLNLMTYDEIMDYQVKFFDRMKLLDIRS
jgi:hypothetical protein